MENEENITTSRTRIKATIGLEDAIDLQSYSKRHPVYGISVRVLQSNPEQEYANIELLFSKRTKQQENQSIVHFFMGYAREVYFKINSKLIG
jgi:hypothetical protein